MKYVLLWLLVSPSTTNICIAGIHGLGDNCQTLEEAIDQSIDAVSFTDRIEGICLNQYSGEKSRNHSMTEQAEKAYEKLEFSSCRDVYLITISQGALIGSYIIARHDRTRMRIRGLTTIGGINRGIHSIHGKLWNSAMKIMNFILPSYYTVLKDYLRDYEVGILNTKTDFLKKAINETEAFETELKQRFLSLDKIVLIGYSKENFTKPHETAYFLWADKQGNLTAFSKDEFFQEDKLGILEQFAKGKLEPFEMEGKHGEIKTSVIARAFIAMRSQKLFNRPQIASYNNLRSIFYDYVEKVKLKTNIENFKFEADALTSVDLPKRVKKIFISLNSSQGIYFRGNNFDHLRFPPSISNLRSRSKDSSIMERLNRHFKESLFDSELENILKPNDKKKVLLGSGHVDKPQFSAQKKVSKKPIIIDLNNRIIVASSSKIKPKKDASKFSTGLKAVTGKETYDGPISKLEVGSTTPKIRLKKQINHDNRKAFK